MKYAIKRRTIGSKNSISISVEEFDSVRDAREGMAEILDIEEKFNIVLENYAEFERMLLNVSLDRMLFSGHDWSAAMNELHAINRTLVNLLSTCRVYIDQVPQNLGAIFKGDSSPVEVLRKQMATEYDGHLGYRVLEAMRNYSQHRALPLQNLSHGLKPVDRAKKRLIEHYVQISIDVSRLEEDKLVKRQVVDELKAIDRYVDVKPLIREYLECFMRLHHTVRDVIADRVNKSDEIILTILERYRTTFNEDVLALGVVAIDDDDKVVEEIPVFDEPVRRRKWLIKKNHLITNLSFHFITSEVEA